MKDNTNTVKDKISVKQYIDNNDLLKIVYVPFDQKLHIISNIINGLIESTGGLNSALLRRIFTEVVIESVSNIDMSLKDENELSGFDQLCMHHELDNLKLLIGNEYIEFEKIMNEYIADYVRIETNPAITINSIYNQLQKNFSSIIDYLSQRIQDIDVDELVNEFREMIPEKVGENS